MKKDPETTEIGKQYAAAYAVHYRTKDLKAAVELYRDIITAHPEAHEAEYSRSQIQNIAKSMVSKQALLDAEITLILAHLKSEEALLTGSSPAMPIP